MTSIFELRSEISLSPAKIVGINVGGKLRIRPAVPGLAGLPGGDELRGA
jgi:hypothetical protein